MTETSKSDRVGQLAVGPLRTMGGFPVKPFIVYMPGGEQPVHEFESLVDVANFAAMRRVQLTPLAQQEGYPTDWEDPTEADWMMLGRMLNYMRAPT